MADFTAGANQDGKHWFGLNWERDLPLPELADIRNVVEGDPSPDGKGTLTIARGIEVGHIFQLSDRYSSAMKATVLDENGEERLLVASSEIRAGDRVITTHLPNAVTGLRAEAVE